MATPVQFTTYSIEVDGVPLSDTPIDVELRQEWFSHDLMFIRLTATKAHPYKRTLTTWRKDATIKVIWGRGPTNMNTWYGYVNHHEFSQIDDEHVGNLQVTYVCIGTSRSMCDEYSTMRQNQTYSQMAMAIARSNKFRCVVTSTTKLRTEAQTSESDFDFLKRMAHKTGFKFWVSGGTLYFIDPRVVLAGTTGDFVPAYTIDLIDGQQDPARNFFTTNGVNVPGSEIATRDIYGFEKDGKVVKGSAPPDEMSTRVLLGTHRHAVTQAELKRIANANKSLSQFWISGSVEVFGHTLLYPGKLIHLSGYSHPNDVTGYWMVAGNKHMLRRGGTTNPMDDAYVTRVDIIRNVEANMPKISGIRRVLPEIIDCVGAGGRWQAASTAVFTQGSVDQ